MGQNLSCSVTNEHAFFTAVQQGDLQKVEAFLQREPHLLSETTVYDKLSPLHIASANGQIEVLSLLLNRNLNPDALSRHKQTPLMMAAMYGKVSCIERLLQAGANILLFDSLNGRTCLHYAANYGHTNCLEAILSAAQSTPVANSWGFARFVNVRDGVGATPLHLAARMKQAGVVQLLLRNGALVCATTGAHGRPGSTPLHLAARGGCLDSVRELLAWGADRLQRDASGRIPYAVALKYKHSECVALLNPTAAEPLVWPSPWKFISQLNPEAKLLLEKALMEANRAREKNIMFGAASSVSSSTDQEDNIEDNISDVCSFFSSQMSIGWSKLDRMKTRQTQKLYQFSVFFKCLANIITTDWLSLFCANLQASESEVCCICFDQLCTIEVQDCGHQMCALCTLALCCHNKPNPTTAFSPPPACPFCRRSIAQLGVIPPKESSIDTDSLKTNKPRQSKSFSEGSSSFKGISAKGSFGKISGKGSGKIADSSDWMEEKS